MTVPSQSFAPQQLTDLSEEVTRIASALARLSLTLGSSSSIVRITQDEPAKISVAAVEWLIKARSQRARYLPVEFCDPMWDILLDLLRAELLNECVSVSSVCLAAGVPPTTALRYVQKMAAEGIIIRRPDPYDGRRIFVELAPETSKALRKYVVDVIQPALLTT